ncbi:MAG: replication-relaxation family protein [Clostridiales bacterium]|nr:replication-relaxation family protein [Clostridiales bacterium]
MSRPRVSRGRLQAIRSQLSERDMGVIEEVAKNRFLTSHQVRRHHFADHATDTAAIRATNRSLARLADLGLVLHLDRRVGGVRAGSGSHVWTLTEAGARLLRTAHETDGFPARYRAHEPTTSFLEHTLAVAEVCLRLSEADRGGNFSIVELLREPDCWRAYSGRHGGVVHLKPDLSLVTMCGQYEDHWFLEIDRSTEPPSRVVRACLRYEAYRETGAERKRIGVFPAVVWITPDAKRTNTLRSHITRTPGLSRDLYAVVQIDDLPSLIKAGIGPQETGHGA